MKDCGVGLLPFLVNETLAENGTKQSSVGLLPFLVNGSLTENGTKQSSDGFLPIFWNEGLMSNRLGVPCWQFFIRDLSHLAFSQAVICVVTLMLLPESGF